MNYLSTDTNKGEIYFETVAGKSRAIVCLKKTYEGGFALFECNEGGDLVCMIEHEDALGDLHIPGSSCGDFPNKLVEELSDWVEMERARNMLSPGM